jgi:phage shock protein PspC (stress-responsive transcriptional regulator)
MPADGMIAGVCAGIADYLNTDVTWIRLAWVVLSIVPGAIIGGVIAYVAAWVLMPEAGIGARPTVTGRRLLRSTTDRKVAGVCGGLAEYFNVDTTVIRVLFLVITLFGGAGLVVYVVMWILVPDASKAPPTTSAPPPPV